MAIINLTGQGRACEFPNCAAEQTYHGEQRKAAAVHEVDGKALCGYHSPYDQVPEQYELTVKLHEVQTLTADEVTARASFTDLASARRYGSRVAREIFDAPRNRKIDFSGEIAFHPDSNGNPVPMPLRIVETSLSVGDLVTIKLHDLADTPDCYAAESGAYRCSHRHQQVGVIRNFEMSSVGMGLLAVVDWQPLTHLLAGADETPSGPSKIVVTLLNRITPFLRGWEIVEGMRTEPFERHCARCGKVMIEIFYRWSNERPSLVTIGQVNEDHHLSGWRHADGSSYHGDFYMDGHTTPRCQECGYEGGKHCPLCHDGESIVIKQEAYGNRITCTNPACDYEVYHSIGD